MADGDSIICPEKQEPFVHILEDGFGFLTDENGDVDIVRRYTFTNQNYLTIQVITYGAAVTSIKYPDKNGVVDDIVLGFDDMNGYLSPVNPYFGAIIGRCANRIAKGHFKIGDEDYQLSTNLGEHHLHGGFKGFDKVNWKSEIQGNKVVMTYMSKDGEEGYPGEVLTSVSYEMTTTNDLIIEMKATSSKSTPINLTNHTYFNLAGHAAGAEGLYEHTMAVNADKYCCTDEDFIPTGMLKNVVNTLWDLRIGRKLGDVLPHVPYGGYDQNMCIHKTSSECMTFIARVIHPETGRTLEVYSNQPGVQLYTSNYFPSKSPSGDMFEEPGLAAAACLFRRCPLCGQLIRDPDFEKNSENASCTEEECSEENEEKSHKLVGKKGIVYYKHAAFCLMTQRYPDSVHRKNFPNSILKPGETYYHIVKYKFDVYEEVAPQLEEEEIIDDTEMPGEGQEEGVDEEYQDKDEDDLLDAKLEENGR